MHSSWVWGAVGGVFFFKAVMWSCGMGFDWELGSSLLCWVFLGGECGWSSGFWFGLVVGGGGWDEGMIFIKLCHNRNNYS